MKNLGTRLSAWDGPRVRPEGDEYTPRSSTAARSSSNYEPRPSVGNIDTTTRTSSPDLASVVDAFPGSSRSCRPRAPSSRNVERRTRARRSRCRERTDRRRCRRESVRRLLRGRVEAHRRDPVHALESGRAAGELSSPLLPPHQPSQRASARSRSCAAHRDVGGGDRASAPLRFAWRQAPSRGEGREETASSSSTTSRITRPRSPVTIDAARTRWPGRRYLGALRAALEHAGRKLFEDTMPRRSPRPTPRHRGRSSTRTAEAGGEDRPLRAPRALPDERKPRVRAGETRGDPGDPPEERPVRRRAGSHVVGAFGGLPETLLDSWTEGRRFRGPNGPRTRVNAGKANRQRGETLWRTTPGDADTANDPTYARPEVSARNERVREPASRENQEEEDGEKRETAART